VNPTNFLRQFKKKSTSLRIFYRLNDFSQILELLNDDILDPGSYFHGVNFLDLSQSGFEFSHSNQGESLFSPGLGMEIGSSLVQPLNDLPRLALMDLTAKLSRPIPDDSQGPSGAVNEPKHLLKHALDLSPVLVRAWHQQGPNRHDPLDA
jgi:hypothetical protein